MRVNVVLHHKNPPAGIERYTTKLLPYLSKRADVRVTTLKTKDTTVSSRAIRTYLSLWLQQSNVYREDGEIVHAMGILPFHKDCIDILNIYDLTPWKYLGLYQRTLPRAMGYGMILQAMQAAPKIVTTSEHTKRDIVQMCGRSPKDIYVIPGGVDLEVFRPLNLERTRRTVLFVGEDNPKKNLEKLIEGLSLVKPHPPCLVWAGRKCWPDERKSINVLAAHLRVPLAELGYIP
ncbi:MAG: glycosyltransferase, partial [Nitrososphaerales archaeon]